MFRILRPLALVCALTMTSGAARAEPITIVALGDSLTAGYQLPPGAGFPAQLERALADEGLDVSVLDAGVSGDTTSGGLSRLDWSVGEEADAVIVELGANDALRGIDPSDTRANLTAILDRLDARGLPVLLAGMLAPPNMGEDYGNAFAGIYDELAARDVVFYPFFLDGVAADPALNLADGMHPTEEGVGVIVERILPKVRELIARVQDAG
ncbi:arylesterase [Acuticoccus sp. M5D2P5]|uniref:arylesterase n=1 Tax=Acuticoccus kalidii TaxID=2910977 RepID=UPI001F2343A6|nr:arylesterase [Acuticoccus kalidii]MCF3933969.1 arylesterase [Acuticoccus kalidii]